MPLETFPFDPAECLDAEGQAELVADALSYGNGRYISHALNTVARARFLSQFARDAGLTDETLRTALGPDGDPRLSTLLGVLAALGIKLSATVEQSVPAA